ncbi:MAG: acyl-CoA dehydrogenase family protein [Betaproteobacteria bacterium]|jgi:putative acyl-CoA dehydrogenase|nr:acyl-CoA dehydrogenase family protein [Betaproteobacteria bacterium]MBK7277912.1 acyl-CoA dehydrogenase family protein [Betaproteobacteria bacterium]
MHATHEVTNQSTPYVGVNLFRANRPLRDALHLHAPELELARLDELGAEAGSAALQAHARRANAHLPVLHTHDRHGRRIDEVEFHPSYHALLASALRHGLHGTPWSRGPGGHVERAAAFMLFTEAEPSVLCPVSMSYAAAPALRANPALHAAWGPKLAHTAYDERFIPFDQKSAVTIGMGMTEKQGGSDVRANTTRATPHGKDGWGQRYAVTGHKWFFSAPMCDAFLVLAQTASGLSCLFMPRFLPDGRLNAIAVQRLKHKLGNHANASSEVEFDHATAWLVGEEGRGIPQILAMGALTRLDCALGTAGLMRHALSLALHHTAQRHAFGRPLIAQPLMQNVLADLALESEAATALALRVAVAVDRTDHAPDEHEAVMRRLLTPVAKFWICKRGSHFAQEAMECLGGNGYVEAAGEGVMARIYREMPVNSIWEGAGNIMAIDLLRALRGADVLPALERELAPARGAHAAFDRAAGLVLHSVEQGVHEAQARILARDLALVLQAALLQRQAPAFVFDAFCASRLAATPDVFGLLPAGLDLEALVERALPEPTPQETS